MAIECYNDKCIHHASYGCTDPENCDGPVCYQDECIYISSYEDKEKSFMIV